MNILWIDDEPRILEEGSAFLITEGFQVQTAGSYQEALPLLKAGSIDLILLDWMLPGVSGLDICKEVQIQWRLPVIMLTAKTGEFDKVLALEIGADDYIAKPFSMKELTARIKAVIRRMGKWNASTPNQQVAEVEEKLVYGDLEVNLHRHEVTRSGELIPLTATEYNLLEVLVRYPGRVYSRLQLLDAALGPAFAGFERTIDSHIRNLRRKIEEDTANPRYVQTVFGVGYKLEDAWHKR